MGLSLSFFWVSIFWGFCRRVVCGGAYGRKIGDLILDFGGYGSKGQVVAQCWEVRVE